MRLAQPALLIDISRIEALNRTGGGAVFRFTLPVALPFALSDAGELS